MLFVLFALWIIALGLVMVDPRSSTMRWMSAIAFTGGFGALRPFYLIPYSLYSANSAQSIYECPTISLHGHLLTAFLLWLALFICHAFISL